ncbi:hypothetical protein [Absidia glauca]|uniref:Uncharacterized protein n=1 Tax=Absidia glauca TaxID=4829 RepID=A0A168NJJ1_ABSGL|nr:hypothetical protein [Absidia glauca]
MQVLIVSKFQDTQVGSVRMVLSVAFPSSSHPSSPEVLSSPDDRTTLAQLIKYPHLTKSSHMSPQLAVSPALSAVCVREVDHSIWEYIQAHTDFLPQQQQEQQHHSSQLPSQRRAWCQESSTDTVAQKRRHGKALSGDGIAFSLDLSQAFHQLQLAIFDSKWKFSLEDHVHLALTSTSVLLLSRNRHPEYVKACFGYNNWNAAIDFIEDKYGIKRHAMPLEDVNSLLAIADKSFTESDRSRTSGHRNQIAATGVPHPQICNAFLFSHDKTDPNNDTYLRWTNESTLEAKIVNDSTGRPDFCITKSCGVKWSASVGYGEAKPASREHDNYLVCKDLMKVAVFCKEVLDSQVMEGMMGIQVVVPDSLDGLPSLITEVSKMMKVLDAFDRVCVPASNIEATSNRRATTITMEKFDNLFTKSKNSKIPCHIKLRHN